MATIDKEINVKFNNSKHRMMVNVIFTSSWIRNQYIELTKEYSISVQQMNILRILKGAGDWLSMNVVKERMIEKSPNATRLADKLMNKGLIERRRSDSDRRVVYVNITQKGKDLLAEVQKIEDANPLTYLDNISDEEADMVSKVLDKLRA